VAAFNIVAMLVMVVNDERDRRRDFAHARRDARRACPGDLRHAGSRDQVGVGCSSVLALGVLLADNVTQVVAWLERTFGFPHLRSRSGLRDERIPAGPTLG
jgi:hypothetical protein